MRARLAAWWRERTAARERTHGTLEGGPSFAHVFGWVLALLLVIEAVSGAALAAFYSPSTTNAWASVAYIQDRVHLGWFVRGLHYHGTSALVIVAGIHLVQTAVRGAYRRPRELVWWLGLVLLVLVLGFAISGYVLRWDQAGYWANRVEVGVAAGTPILGKSIRAHAIGGNDWGNLTLTRFYALHVIVLPAITLLGVGAHILFARRHGATPRAPGMPAAPRWPAQSLRAAIAMAATTAILLAYVVHVHGADLAAPADPSAAYDARPLWYFRWLFELRQLAKSYEEFAALVAPAVVGGYLAALPILDRRPDRAWRARLGWLGGVAGLLALIGALTLASLAGDRGDADLAKRQQLAERQAERARALAVEYGVPATGPRDLPAMQPMYRARSLFEQRCKGCHDADSKKRKGPVIGPGHGSREWLRGFFKAPSSPEHYGLTKLSKTDDAMKSVDLQESELDDLIEAMYAESGATDVDVARRDRGRKIFEKACTDCHDLHEGVAGSSAPGLAGLNSRDYYTSFIGNPKAAIHMGPDKSEMPRFDKDLSIVDRDALAGYLVWLRTATAADLAKLGPL